MDASGLQRQSPHWQCMSLAIDDGDYDMLRELQRRFGARSLSQAMRRLIRERWIQEFARRKR